MIGINNYSAALNQNVGAMKRNTNTGATLQPLTRTPLKQNGQTTVCDLTIIQPNQGNTLSKVMYDGNNYPKTLKEGDTLYFKKADGSIDVFLVTYVDPDVISGNKPGQPFQSVWLYGTNADGTAK